MRAYSSDLRDRVLGALERGERPTAIAERYEVSRVWVYQVRRRFQTTGRRDSLPMGGYRRSRLADKESLLREWIQQKQDLTLVQMCGRLAEHGIEIKPSALCDQLNKWNLTFKKNSARRRARERIRASGAA